MRVANLDAADQVSVPRDAAGLVPATSLLVAVGTGYTPATFSFEPNPMRHGGVMQTKRRSVGHADPSQAVGKAPGVRAETIQEWSARILPGALAAVSILAGI